MVMRLVSLRSSMSAWDTEAHQGHELALGESRPRQLRPPTHSRAMSPKLTTA